MFDSDYDYFAYVPTRELEKKFPEYDFRVPREHHREDIEIIQGFAFNKLKDVFINLGYFQNDALVIGETQTKEDILKFLVHEMLHLFGFPDMETKDGENIMCGVGSGDCRGWDLLPYHLQEWERYVSGRDYQKFYNLSQEFWRASIKNCIHYIQ